MKSNYKTRAKKFIAQLFPFIEIAFYTDNSEMKKRLLFSGVEQYCQYYSKRVVKSNRGISRVALITSDYVVKIDYNEDSGFGCSYDEVEAYEYAYENGYAEYFAEITEYYYEGFPFYIMPLVKHINDDDYDVYEYLHGDAYHWISENFYDLHSGNYGWKNGHPVIFDYAARQQITTGFLSIWMFNIQN